MFEQVMLQFPDVIVVVCNGGDPHDNCDEEDGEAKITTMLKTWVSRFAEQLVLLPTMS